MRKGTSWHKFAFSVKFIGKDFVLFILIIHVFQPWKPICIDTDIVQHVNLREIMFVTNSNTRSFAFP